MSNIDQSDNGIRYSKCGKGWIAYHKDAPLTGVYVYPVIPFVESHKNYWMAKSDGKKLLDSPTESRAQAAYFGLKEKEKRYG